jgi:hypothetical protein
MAIDELVCPFGVFMDVALPEDAPGAWIRRKIRECHNSGDHTLCGWSKPPSE